MDTHLIQEIHLLLSESFSSSAEIAPDGHFRAHRPQEVQVASALGIIPVPAFLYGLLPGTTGVDNAPEAAFSRIRLPNSESSSKKKCLSPAKKGKNRHWYYGCLLATDPEKNRQPCLYCERNKHNCLVVRHKKSHSAVCDWVGNPYLSL